MEWKELAVRLSVDVRHLTAELMLAASAQCRKKSLMRVASIQGM